jgi:hypothetical protein
MFAFASSWVSFCSLVLWISSMEAILRDNSSASVHLVEFQVLPSFSRLGLAKLDSYWSWNEVRKTNPRSPVPENIATARRTPEVIEKKEE